MPGQDPQAYSTIQIAGGNVDSIRRGRQVRVMLLLGGSTVCSTSHFRSV